MKKIVIGILAHVDAGKTTCIEAMLYTAGKIKKLGRVDHRDAFLDYDEEERNHGITIYAKEANLHINDTDIYVIDTPGHVDFSSEMERSLQALDLAVILINGQDGVQSHSETIWKCLEHYHIPTIVFVNKMDISYLTKEELMSDLNKHFSEHCVNFQDEDSDEKIAMCSDDLLNEYIDTSSISLEHIKEAVFERKVFPCIFGSALKVEGIKELLDTICFSSIDKEYGEEFGAIVYKVDEDKDGTKLTHIKLTGGSLKVKTKIGEEKVDQIRIYNGLTYELKDEVFAGDICALKGLSSFEAGQGLGNEKDHEKPLLNPVMDYELVYPKEANVLELSETCKKLANEDPQLQLSINPLTKKIHIRIMGEMQMEILQKRIYQACAIHVTFTEGRIVYKETIRNSVIGRGHFEPLRHYAEVHVRLDPLPHGSGIVISNECTRDSLSPAWQRMILSALSSFRHRGVLTGSLLTDVKITLLAGRGNIKHTESGDFREASIRAVRQGLMKAESVLLEPYYFFTLVVPRDKLSFALFDLEKRECTTEFNDEGLETITITGKGPVRLLLNYQNDVVAYTKGRGRYSYQKTEYFPSEDSEKLAEESRYNPDSDLRNPSGSVFCSHGSGYFVPWFEADDLMHIEIREKSDSVLQQNEKVKIEEKDLKHILESAGGNNKNTNKQVVKKKEDNKEEQRKTEPLKPQCYIIDGYNMIFSWDELNEISKTDITTAREMLIDIIYNYQAYIKSRVILVFDGYKVKDNPGSTFKKGRDMTVVYTKYGQSADSYIEKASSDLRKDYTIVVATSDNLIQNAALAHGALRLSARELESRIKLTKLVAKG